MRTEFPLSAPGPAPWFVALVALSLASCSEPDVGATGCDDDGDGVLAASCGGLDCDDDDPAVHPQADDGIDCAAPVQFVKVREVSGGQATSPSLAVDAGGQPHVAWYDAAAKTIRYASGADLWTVQTVVADVTMTACGKRCLSLAIDDAGKAHLAYHDGAVLNLAYATNASGAWAVETAANNGPRNSPALVLDGAAVHILSYAPLKDALYHVTRSDSAGSWESTQILDSGRFCALAAQPGGGTLTAAVTGPENKVRVVHWDAVSGWDAPTTVSEGQTLAGPSIAMSADGVAHVAWDEVASSGSFITSIHHASSADGWTTVEPLVTSDQPSLVASVAVLDDDLTGVTWGHESAHDAGYAVLAGDTWQRVPGGLPGIGESLIAARAGSPAWLVQVSGDFQARQLAVAAGSVCVWTDTNCDGVDGVLSQPPDPDASVTDTGGDAASDGEVSLCDGCLPGTLKLGFPAPKRIAAGGSHTCVITGGDEVACWGQGRSGQLGLGRDVPCQPTGAVVPGLAGATAVAASSLGSCAIVGAAGEVYCWGRGEPVGGDKNHWNPTKVEGVTGAVDIVGALNHFCVRDLDGAVTCWGTQTLGTVDDVEAWWTAQTVVSAPPAQFLTAANGYGVAIITADHRLFELSADINSATPWRDAFASQVEADDVASPVAYGVGALLKCLLAHDGTLWCKRGFGQDSLFQQMPGLDDVTALGESHGDSLCFQRAGNETWCLETVYVTPDWVNAPDEATRVAGLPATDQVSVGGNYVCARTTVGGARCWGANDRAQLGNGSGGCIPEPQEVIQKSYGIPAGPTEFVGVSRVDAGPSGVAAIKGGEAWLWGPEPNYNIYLTYNYSAGRLSTPSSVDPLQAVVTGTYICTLSGDQTVACADGVYQQSVSGPDLTGLTDTVALAAGADHACALDGAGQVRCWGAAGDWLGGSGLDAPVPGLPLAQTVAAGDDHTCALSLVGEVWCWGANDHGQLGDGTLVASAGPVLVSNLTGVTSVDVDAARSCAVDGVGAVWCWGAAHAGDTAVPIPAGGPGPFDAVAVGYDHACAALADESGVRCWGGNGFGQLGNGTLMPTTAAWTPILPPPVHDVVAGQAFSCARVGSLGSERVYCWGGTAAGRLGVGYLSSQAPVVVYGLGQ